MTEMGQTCGDGTARRRVDPSWLTVGLVVAVTIWASGCARDTDALICPEGTSKEGSQCISTDVAIDLPCVDAENLDTTGVEPPRKAGEDCVNWADCEGDLVCLFDPISGGECSERCEPEGCSTGEICSVAGICTVAGGASPGDECDEDTSCTAGFACSGNVGICTEICDPRDPICPDSLECLPLPSGLGRCMRQCN